jgi:hypothetical protein
MKEFLEKRWWQGVGGIAGILALVFVVLQFLGIVSVLGLSIALNIIFVGALVVLAIYAIKWKRKSEEVGSRLKETQETLRKTQEFLDKVQELLDDTEEILRRVAPERARVLLPDANDISKLSIDNTLLSQLYGEAYGRAVAKYHDAKLRALAILAYPYAPLDRVSIHFDFYSRWADRLCTYFLGEVGDMVESEPDKPAQFGLERMIFDELPWLAAPDWPQFLKKSCEKVGPLSPARWTTYQLWARAGPEPQWGISFGDGITGKEFDFSWDGKGDPMAKERLE